MPLPSSTAATMRMLNPLSPSFMMKSLFILAGMFKLIVAPSFSANGSNYDIYPVSPEFPAGNATIFSYVYNSLNAGACGANRFRHIEGHNVGTVVNVPGVKIVKDSRDTNSSADQCMKGLVNTAVNTTFNTLNATNAASYNDDRFYRTRNIVWGTLYPILGIIALLALAAFIYSMYLKCTTPRAQPIVIDVEAQQPAQAAAQEMEMQVIEPQKDEDVTQSYVKMSH